MLGFLSLEYMSIGIRSDSGIWEAREGLNLNMSAMEMLFESIFPLLVSESQHQFDKIRSFPLKIHRL